MNDMFNTADIVRIVDVMTETIIANEVPFCELDAAAGDGDFGMSLAKGFKELKKAGPDLPTEEIGAYLKACGMVITEHCGGASGPIWGSAFRAAGKWADGRTELDAVALAELLKAAVEGIQKRGGARLGDKTLLDALIPAATALAEAAPSGMAAAMDACARAAVAGAEKTKELVASKGRASYVGERSLSHPDAGAVAIGVIFSEIAKAAVPA